MNCLHLSMWKIKSLLPRCCSSKSIAKASEGDRREWALGHPNKRTSRRWWRRFFHCPPPLSKGKKNALARASWKGALFLLTMLIIFLKKKSELETLLFASSKGAQMPQNAVKGLWGLSQETSSFPPTHWHSYHTVFWEIPSSRGLVRKADA